MGDLVAMTEINDAPPARGLEYTDEDGTVMEWDASQRFKTIVLFVEPAGVCFGCCVIMVVCVLCVCVCCGVCACVCVCIHVCVFVSDAHMCIHICPC